MSTQTIAFRAPEKTKNQLDLITEHLQRTTGVADLSPSQALRTIINDVAEYLQKPDHEKIPIKDWWRWRKEE
jgi:hypothetical protein